MPCAASAVNHDKFLLPNAYPIERGEHAPLLNYQSKGEDAQLSVPTPEHYLPLLYVLGTQQPGEKAQIFGDAIDLASISMTTVVIDS